MAESPVPTSTDTLRLSPSSAPKLHLAFRPTVPLISETRHFAGHLLDSVLDDSDAASRVALTIHELLENTLKYSIDGLAQIVLLVSDEAGRRTIEVRASNQASPEQAAELSRRIEAIGQASDPMGFYIGLMRESAQRGGSGLGLARIRVEGEMSLSCALEGDKVTVSATTPAE